MKKISLESINERLGFDYFEAANKYAREGPDDIFASPVWLLTEEELRFMKDLLMERKGLKEKVKQE